MKIIHGRAINKDRNGQHKQKTNKGREIEDDRGAASQKETPHEGPKQINDMEVFFKYRLALVMRNTRISPSSHELHGVATNYRVEDAPSTIFEGDWAIEGNNNTSLVLSKPFPRREATRLTKRATIYRVPADRPITRRQDGKVTVWADRRKVCLTEGKCYCQHIDVAVLA